MNREKQEIFEKIQFNDVAYATDIVDKNKEKLKRVYIGVGLALVASILCWIGWHQDYGKVQDALFIIGIVCTAASYIVGGGILTAVKWALKIAKFGWLITPFPIDIITGIIAIGLSILCFIFFPIVFVLLHMFQIMKNTKEAEEYLKHCMTNSDEADG